MLRWSLLCVLRGTLVLSAAVVAAGSAAAQDTGHGDVFGDLVHILRSPVTGQPILQKRIIEYPGDILDWGYCPIPVDAAGAEIPFLDNSCEIDPTQAGRLIEVDYFGRLSGGRTKERNIRMHFDEVITNIIEADVLAVDPAGRLKFGSDCTLDGLCAQWKVIDSPLENMAFYHRLMKYGHVQTDPLEVDTSFHGDPVLGTVYHPALRAEDWAKFAGVLTALLPRASSSECFNPGFVAACAAPQTLAAEDFVRAASFLGGAADKHGKMTVDLVQYFNRILKITVATADSLATVNTLPALIRDESGIHPADPGLPVPADELFVDYSAAYYVRSDRFNTTTPALISAGVGLWSEDPSVPLLPFLEYVFGPIGPVENITAFVTNAGDAQRAIEFVHEYEIPVNLWAVYAVPTTTTIAPVVAPSSATELALTLTAVVANTTPVNGGTVTFSVQTSAGTPVGVSAVSGTVTGGAASAMYVLPGGFGPQVLQIVGVYSGAPGFAGSSGMGTLTITPDPPPQLSVANTSASEGSGALVFTLSLSMPSTLPVTAQFAAADFTALAPVDYLPVSGTATIAPGATTTSVTVPIVRDSTREPNETLSLTLSATTNAVLVRAVATGQILDDDGTRTPVLDANGDRSADIFWRHAVDGRIAIWYMSGTTQLWGRVTEPEAVPDLNWEIRAVGDFNGDWKPDLIWQHRLTGALAAWFMNLEECIGTRDLTTISGGTTEPVLEWKIVGAADMDGDDQLDLIWQHQVAGELRIWHMSGTVQIDSVPIGLGVPASDWHVVGVEDMNRDGRNDLVWRETTTGGLAAWLMADAQVLAAEWLTPDNVGDTSWRIVGVRDMNFDGKPDLLWQHGGTGQLAAWFMNGLTVSSTTDLTPAVVADLDWKGVGIR